MLFHDWAIHGYLDHSHSELAREEEETPRHFHTCYTLPYFQQPYQIQARASAVEQWLEDIGQVTLFFPHISPKSDLVSGHHVESLTA